MISATLTHGEKIRRQYSNMLTCYLLYTLIYLYIFFSRACISLKLRGKKSKNDANSQRRKIWVKSCFLCLYHYSSKKSNLPYRYKHTCSLLNFCFSLMIFWGKSYIKQEFKWDDFLTSQASSSLGIFCFTFYCFTFFFFFFLALLYFSAPLQSRRLRY